MQYIILYNCRFEGNHPELYNKCKQLAQEGKVEFLKYKEYFKTTEQLKEIVKASVDIFDLIPRGKQEEIADMKLSDALQKMIKSTRDYLVSVILIDKSKPDFIWLECGQVKLKEFFSIRGW